MMDTVIVGKFLGVHALASVGSTGSVNFMIIGFCMGVCNGFAIPVAQQFGAGDYHNLRKYAANSVWLAIAFAGVMTVTVCVFCRQILMWMDTPSDIMEGAYDYIFHADFGSRRHRCHRHRADAIYGRLQNHAANRSN